jgi:hypothetical protein
MEVNSAGMLRCLLVFRVFEAEYLNLTIYAELLDKQVNKLVLLREAKRL